MNHGRPDQGRPHHKNHEEKNSMKRNGVFGKMVVLGIIGAFAVLALATPALAQKA
jgi:hypothetical protein